jgi:predicted neuraminidase
MASFVQTTNWPNPSSRIMALRSTQALTEMSTRNLPGGKRWPARKADNLTAICVPIV